ncbi:allantoate amidohydrolase [Sporosarcina sp. CAU 1771]
MKNSTASLQVNLSRLKETFEVSSKIGAVDNGGLTRLALTEEDKEMRNIFIKWLEDEGLQVRVDDLGNIYGRREGSNKELGSIMIGSHLDSVPKGGRFDGVLGVLSALEVIRTLNDQQIETERPIEIVNFTNEEGERFSQGPGVVPMQGSGVITGNFEKEYVYRFKDKDGTTFEQSLEEIGFMGKEEHRPSNVEYFIELHIEQGPFLEENQKEIGIVQGIKGSKRHKVIVKGKSSHGAYPNNHRKDALLAASEMALAIDGVAAQFEDLVTAVDVFQVSPSVESITAETVEFMFQVRHINEEVKTQAVQLIKEQFERILEKRDVSMEFTQTSYISGAYFSEEILKKIEEAATSFGYSYQSITSPALHDARFMHDITKTAMIFAPSKAGLSHCPGEFTSYEDIEKATNVLLHTVLSLAK